MTRIQLLTIGVLLGSLSPALFASGEEPCRCLTPAEQAQLDKLEREHRAWEKRTGRQPIDPERVAHALREAGREAYEKQLKKASPPDPRLVELEMEMVQLRIENLIGRPLFSSEKAHLRKAVERRLTERAAAAVPKSNQQEAGKALKEE